MKRFCLMAAVAALTLGAAQAAGIDWNVSNTIDSTNGSYLAQGSGSVPGCFANDTATFAISLSTGATLGQGTIWALGNSNTGTGALNPGNRITVAVNNGGTLTINAFGSQSATSETALTAGSQNTLAITINRDANHACTINLYLNGTNIATVTATATQGPINSVAWGSNFGEAKEYTGDIAFGEYALYAPETGDGILSAEQLANLGLTQADIPGSVPEPTALALLALGVAGVALRRRVA